MRLLVFLAFLPTLAFAGYIDTKSDWVEMDTSKRLGYVMGFVDGFVPQSSEPEQFIEYKADLISCLVDLKILSNDLVEIVDTQYKELENWDKPPAFVLQTGVRKVCLATINGYRATRGQEPYP